jgi:elongation factor Ts
MTTEKQQTITPAMVKKLRELTGAGMMNCKEALTLHEANFDKAIEHLRQKGLASAEKKSVRKAKEGLIEAYIHSGSKLGVLLELNCETDFVARRPEFKDLAKSIAMQIASSLTLKYVSLKDIPESLIENEKRIESEKEDILKKPENIREKIVLGRVEKTLKEYTLLDQPYIKNQEITIEELIKQNIALLGENIQVARFSKFNLGETNS